MSAMWRLPWYVGSLRVHNSLNQCATTERLPTTEIRRSRDAWSTRSDTARITDLHYMHAVYAYIYRIMTIPTYRTNGSWGVLSCLVSSNQVTESQLVHQSKVMMTSMGNTFALMAYEFSFIPSRPYFKHVRPSVMFILIQRANTKCLVAHGHRKNRLTYVTESDKREGIDLINVQTFMHQKQ